MNAGPLTLTPGLAAGVQQGSVPNAALISSNATDLYYRYYPSGGNLNNANAAAASVSASASASVPTTLNPNSPPQNATPNASAAASSVLNSGLLAIQSAPALPAFSGALAGNSLYQSYPSANLVALYSSVPAGANSYCQSLANAGYGAASGDYSLAYLGSSGTAGSAYCATGTAVETRGDAAADGYAHSNLLSSNAQNSINNNAADKSAHRPNA